MVLRSSANGIDSCNSTVFVDGVLFLILIISLLIEYLLYTCALFSQLFVHVCFQYAVVQCLEDAVDVVANVELALGVNQVFRQWFEKLGGLVLCGIVIEHFNLLTDSQIYAGYSVRLHD